MCPRTQPVLLEEFLVDELGIESATGVVAGEGSFPLTPAGGVERCLAPPGEDGIREQVGAEPAEQVRPAAEAPGAAFGRERRHHRGLRDRVPHGQPVLGGADDRVVQAEPGGALVVDRPGGRVPAQRSAQRCFVRDKDLAGGWA